MLNLEGSEQEIFKDNFIEELGNRKNLIVYDGINDGLEENIKNKYFYSNPYDPLEFIVIDIYSKPVINIIYNKKVEIFGIVSIIKEKCEYINRDFETVYGVVRINDICIRGIKKNEITMYINKHGLQDLKGVVLYFEDYFCKKMHHQDGI